MSAEDQSESIVGNEESEQNQINQVNLPPSLAIASSPDNAVANRTPGAFNIYNALVRNNSNQYTFYVDPIFQVDPVGIANRWQQNFQYTLGPANSAFIDATLSYQDIAWGYRLEYNPNGVLWRVSANGIPNPDDYNNFLEQNRVIEGTTNRTIAEVKGGNSNGPANDDKGSDQSTLAWGIKKGLTIDPSGKIVVNNGNDDNSVSNLVYYDNHGVGKDQQVKLVGWWDDAKNYVKEQFEILKEEGESLADTALGTLVIDKMKNTFSIFKQAAPSLGPAGTIEVAVDTTPGGVIALKGVSKVFGGVVSLGQTTYDIYVDYKTFRFTESFVKAAGADIATTAVVAIGSGASVSAGAPVIAVSIGGGYLVYLVNQKIINPWKNSLETL